MKQHGFVLRKSQKKKSRKNVDGRNEQFEKIQLLKEQFISKGLPVISIDTKKKEMIGNFYREGRLYTTKAIEVLDHDFLSYADGVIIPHGIYDITLNKAHIHIGTSKDTSEFACDCLKSWWESTGSKDYPNAREILILCDGGGSNSSRSNLFKFDIQALANILGIAIRIAHYPPYCSKYNPIEHKLFPHITRSCAGVVFKSVTLVRQLIEKTKTKTGLKVSAKIIDKLYLTGRKIKKTILKNINIVKDETHPLWNYKIIPQS